MRQSKFRGAHADRPGRRRPSRRVRLVDLTGLELLDRRVLPAVTATFAAAQGVLTVIGDAKDNTITVGRDAAGMILVNNGQVSIDGGAPTVDNTALVSVFGVAGNDTISLDETNGALSRANLFGGAGNDTLTGGSGADVIDGQSGNDTLLGRRGNDSLFGGAGDDVLTAGVGDDQVFGQAGNDRMIWNPGDGSALNEGGAGSDTVEVIGGNVAEVYSITANGSRVRLDRVNPAPFFLDIGTSENLVLNARGGEDVISADNGLAGLIQLTLDGGAGNDTITGGDGDDVLLGGVGVGELDQNDLIIGGRGNDTLFGEDGHNSGFGGNDVFVWNPGDGSDTVEGEGGMNFLQFNGSNASEHIDISANGERVRFSRDIDNVTMDLNDIVQLNFTALGGADVITVNDLSGTDLRIVPLDLAAAPGGTASDGVADTVVVNGTNGDDVVDVPAVGNALAVLSSAGRFVFVRITDPTDRLVINGLGGDDQISAPTLPAATAALTIDGGAGNDVILGGAGNDTLTGGSGNDFIVGGAGNDTVFLGAGDDDFQWNPGDGSDIVEGQAGFDTMLFIGSDAGEKFDLSANGGRLRFTRDVDNVALDVDDTERVDVAARGGADTVTVNDLSGTNVTEVNINLAVVQSGGDGDADTVIINGTKRDDTIRVAGGAGGAMVLGLAARVNIIGAEAANDRLTVDALAGDDTVHASGLSAGAILLTEDGGDGDDVLIGSAGDDTLLGGAGDDVLIGGAGNDSLVGGAGDDVLIGGPGQDGLDGGPGDNILIQD